MEFLTEILGFLRTRKKLFLLPLLIVMLFFGAFLIFAQSSVLAPFIYSLF